MMLVELRGPILIFLISFVCNHFLSFRCKTFIRLSLDGIQCRVDWTDAFLEAFQLGELRRKSKPISPPTISIDAFMRDFHFITESWWSRPVNISTLWNHKMWSIINVQYLAICISIEKKTTTAQALPWRVCRSRYVHFHFILQIEMRNVLCGNSVRELVAESMNSHRLPTWFLIAARDIYQVAC